MTMPGRIARGGNEWQRATPASGPGAHIAPSSFSRMRLAIVISSPKSLRTVSNRQLFLLALAARMLSPKASRIAAIPPHRHRRSDAMHRTRASAVAAQRDHDVATIRIPAPRHVVRPIGVQPAVLQQPLGRSQSVSSELNTRRCIGDRGRDRLMPCPCAARKASVGNP